MDIRPALKSQYHAALLTLRKCIEQCPETLWNDPADGGAGFWRVAYHTLFFTHFYSHQDRGQLKPWDKHRRGVEHFDSADKIPYTKDECLEYWHMVNERIDSAVDALDLAAPQCGFPWYKMGTLEHQLANIRHIQHHGAILASRLRIRAGVAIDWVQKG